MNQQQDKSTRTHSKSIDSPTYENLTRPVTHTGKRHSNSYSQGDSYPGPSFPPLQTQPRVLQRPLSVSHEDGQYMVMGIPTTDESTERQDGIINEHPQNTQFAYFPEGYVVMLSQGQVDPYHTIPAIHRGGFPGNSNEQYRARNKSETLPVFRHPVMVPHGQGGRSHSIPNIPVSADPLTTHGNSLPQGDDHAKSTTQGQETSLRADTPFSEVTPPENNNSINCVPLYLSIETGKVYVDQSKAVTFHTHQLLDVSKIACLTPPPPPPTRPPFAGNFYVRPPQVPTPPISTEPNSSPIPRLQPQPPPRTNIGISNPMRNLSSSTNYIEGQVSSEQRRESSSSSNRNQAVELNMVRSPLNSQGTAQEGRTRFTHHPEVAAQDRGHSYYYCTIIVSAVILICLDLFALIFLLPAFYFAHKADKAKQNGHYDVVRRHGRRALILNIVAIIVHMLFIIVFLAVFFVIVFVVVM